MGAASLSDAADSGVASTSISGSAAVLISSTAAAFFGRRWSGAFELAAKPLRGFPSGFAVARGCGSGCERSRLFGGVGGC